MYTIRANYQTGDSFHTEETSTTEGEWSSLEIAKENLQRIKIHYSYYEYKDKYLYSSFKEREWKGKSVPDFIVIDKKYADLIMLKLKADNGEEYQIYPPWCGHFERLHGAEIIIVQDDSMAFTVN